MPNPPVTVEPTAQTTSASAEKSVHYELIKKALPDWLLKTSPTRVSALKGVKLTLPDWHRQAAASAHAQLKGEIRKTWSTQNDVDRALSKLQDVYSFARPLLQKALKDRFGVEDDVEATWVRLYMPANTSWWTRDFASGKRSRTVSLLDAALHNFSSDESFSADSEFITRPDARGHFQVKPLKAKLSIKQFQALCRELNIGASYQRHLHEFVLSKNHVASNYLRIKVVESEKQALRTAARMALLKKDIDQRGFDVIQGMIEDRAQVLWHDRPVRYHTLSMMDTSLSGIVVIAADLLSADHAVPVIAYVPHDPEHPLKQYPTALALMNELSRQLRDNQSTGSYQQFFSQFVAHQQRGYFFARLNERLSKVKWQPVPAGSSLPTWREWAVDNPNLQFRLSKIEDDRQTRFTGDLWKYLYKKKLNKILNDGRELAISTEYADRMARWAWWDNLEKMLSDILNVALLVATPFVPGLGTLMLAYTAYQLTDEVIEGIVDLAEGRLAEAGEQTISVLESVVQLGAFAAGTTLGNLALEKLSPFFEGLKPVKVADGQTRLWNPDLSAYSQPESVLPSHSRPDAQGLHTHGEKRLLRVDQQVFEVTKDPVTDEHRVRHPKRPEAYSPTLKHNTRGAWVCETETPRQWQGPKLMRRVSHATDGFTDGQLEQVRQLTGTDENVLRRMHVENAPPPPLLVDTLERLGSHPAPSEAAATNTPAVEQLLVDCPQLTTVLAERVIAQARPLELQQITQRRKVPLRLKTTARELQFEMQSVRAVQGLHREALSNIDSERLLLGTLRRNSDTFGALRIDIRDGSFKGELRCSAGPESAERHRVLVRIADDSYEVRDGDDQLLHDACGLYEAILQAAEHQGRSVMGYGTGESERLKEWILAKTMPPSERRTVLAEPPIRRVAQHDDLLLVRGGGLSRDGATLHERIGDLYPHFSERAVNAFADALTEQGEPLKAIEAQEKDLAELRKIVHRWRDQQVDGWGSGNARFRDGGQHIFERLLDCFERKNRDLGVRSDPSVYALDLSRELLSIDLETWWSKRPVLKKFLDKVTILKLDKARFSADELGVLKDFPNLVELSAKYCELTALPAHIGVTLRRLERLRLSNNHIVLDDAAVKRLSSLTRLEVLKMDDNPLGLSPDLSRMPRLKVVALKNTGLTQWPTGILSKPRPRGLLLDLRGNPLGQLPDVVEKSDAQWLVARTRLDVAALSEVNQVRYQAHRRAMELPPEPIIPAAPEPHTSIISAYGADYWSDVPGWGVDRETPWSELLHEPDAEPFMTALLDVRDFADYRAGGAAREQLMQRVWRMLDAVHHDSQLREKLFNMVVAPVDCADAGAQLFNQMGINVLASEAYAYSIDGKELEQKLVTLAKGAARLKQVNEIARADVASRDGNPDEVEVYLAYQTGLAQRLGLPWQSEGMLYRAVSGVTDTMIDQAYDTVLALGEGDGLVNEMLEQEFWQTHLEQRYPSRLASNKQRYLNLFDKLETLRSTQREWLDASGVRNVALRSRLSKLANDLPVPNSVVYADQPMSDAIYERVLIDLVDEEKELSRQLTREAMRRADI
ncbi:NEL-type E3 ubiquitin ligase domain-containing protein [Pseudomonas sp. EA_5y_Pfl2_R50]|uniref:NEL-type E3 ubiquitin ligase domain-containing protein n=1 Tax=Pseudomonas sp. EA_5y_Pfl2_R50 TaxID=3088691 RepID=UPI0030D6EF1B